MKISKSALSFDAIVFYFWLPEEELNTIFVGIHKWWFAHGLAYRRCIFYGPTIKKFRHFKNGAMDLYAIPSALIKCEALREFLSKKRISHNPVVSIVVEGDRLPNAKELNASSIPIQCFVADTHHMSNAVTSAIAFISEIGASMVFVSHSPHRKIFADCLGLNVHPIVYTPNESSGVELNASEERGARACYYGTIADPFHPERSYILNKIMSGKRESAALDFKPRLQPKEWQESLSKDIASFTCSLNGFPSVQSYAPLQVETCLITDPLSEKSELGQHLRHGENCLIYRNENEAIEAIEFVRYNRIKACEIGKAGKKLINRITRTSEQALNEYRLTTNNLSASLARAAHPHQKIHLNPCAILACYTYEVIQELHRLCKHLFLFILGKTKVADYIKDYVQILPRVTILDSAPDEISITSPEEGECIVWIGNAEPCLKNQQTWIRHSFLLRISDSKNEDLLGKPSGMWLHPGSIISCDFEGRHFPQYIPKNIRLVEQKKGGGQSCRPQILEIIFQSKASDSVSARPLLFKSLDMCINDAEALEVADACDAAGLPEIRRDALLRAVFLNRNCVSAQVQLADLALEGGALVDGALLLSEANRVEKLPEEVGGVLHELMQKVGEAPDIIEYRRAIAGGDFPPPKAQRRILVVTNLFPPQEMGGYGRKIWEFANGLKERGHTVEVLTSNSDYLGKVPHESELALEGVVRRELVLMGEWKDGKTRSTTDAAGQRKIGESNARLVAEAARRFAPEVVLLGNLDFLGVELLHQLLGRGIPVIHSLGNQTPWYQPQQSIKNPNYVVAAASDWLGRNLLQQGYTVPKLETVYPGARVDRFYRHFLPDIRRLRIAFAGLVMAYKGPQLLVDALAKLNKLGIDFEAEIAGDTITPDFVDQLKLATATHGISDRVKFTGFLSREDLAALFARSNVLVFPTLVPEAFGISQVEAMAGGLIVVSSGTGGTVEVVKHLENGIIFNPADPMSLVTWLQRIASDVDLRLRLQKAARADALKFSVTSSVLKIEEITEDLIGKKGVHVGITKKENPSHREWKIEDAEKSFAGGRLTEAEDICREILGKDDRSAGAWALLGRIALLNGDLDTAGDFAAVASELEPLKTEFIRDLGEVFLRRKEMKLAEGQARGALELEPEASENLVLLGRVLAEKGEQGNALGAFEKALRLKKDDAEAITHYAMALQKFDRGKDAISQIRKACALEPDSVEHQTNFASLLEQNKRYVDALAAYGKAARMNPDVGYIWFRQGKLLNGLKRYAEAIPVLKKALALPGPLGEFFYEMGLALHMSKHLPEALEQYEKALEHGFNSAALQCNRGVIFKELRRGGDSIMAFHTAVKMDPSNVSYLNNLGAAALELGLNSEALGCFEEAVRQNPKLPTAQNNIGNLLKDRARGMDALPHYRKAMELDPENHDTQSNYLLCHMYLSEMDVKAVFEEHRKWGLAKAKKTPPIFKFKPRQPGAKLRVGFLSPDFCHHPVAHFIEPLFREYDRAQFEFIAYGDQRKSDEFSERFSKQVCLWRETCSLNDQALAKQIYEDRVDILFELSGHTAHNRLPVLSMKPAPLQASYLGYPGTTGLPTIGFRITDALVDPVGMTEKFHTERLVRMLRCAWCYEPDAESPDVVPVPALQKGHITFGCFNNMAKLNLALFGVWAEILLQVPKSHLRLKARTLTDEGVKKELKEYFTSRGIAEERLDFFGHTRKIHEHLNHYNEVDIALDSYPYHGTTTTCEALWMGCPVVTHSGTSHVSRVGVSLLNAVGLQEFICESAESYIAKAVELSADMERLSILRSGMRARLQASPLMDAKGFAKDFATALNEIAALR